MNYRNEVRFEEVLPLDVMAEVFEHQKVLDAAFLKVANRQPELEDRADAALDEAAEFVAEFKTINKYWTHKETNYDNVLDEHSDIIHFVVGYYIARNKPEVRLHRMIRSNYHLLMDDCEFYQQQNPAKRLKRDKVQYYLRRIRRTDSIVEALAAATIIIGMCGFTKEDVLNQYRIKRDENYRRIAKTAKGEADR